jgi:erythronate-4-phosphate dehydrogenase
MGGVEIVMDENIRSGERAFAGFGNVRLKSGREITSEDLGGTDVLLVRSVTPVNEELLGGTPVRFVGSATTGTDHMDEEYLRDAGIEFVHAPGANADSVVEYVIAALLALSACEGDSLRGKTAGIVGCGQIGGRLARRLPALGMNVVLNDPPLARKAEAAGRSHDFMDLDTLLVTADVLSLHTPLTTDGRYPTYHLIDEEKLAAVRDSAWLVNTCRGPVVDNRALHAALEDRRLGAAVLDVWENEPAPEPHLVEASALATPHIAGYSYDGKIAGTLMLYEALEEFLGQKGGWNYEEELTFDGTRSPVLDIPETSDEITWLDRLVKQMYDITVDDRNMRHLIELPRAQQGYYFTELRRTYPRRRSFSRFVVPAAEVPHSLSRALSVALDLQLR